MFADCLCEMEVPVDPLPPVPRVVVGYAGRKDLVIKVMVLPFCIVLDEPALMVGMCLSRRC